MTINTLTNIKEICQNIRKIFPVTKSSLKYSIDLFDPHLKVGLRYFGAPAMCASVMFGQVEQ